MLVPWSANLIRHTSTIACRMCQYFNLSALHSGIDLLAFLVLAVKFHAISVMQLQWRGRICHFQSMIMDNCIQASGHENKTKGKNLMDWQCSIPIQNLVFSNASLYYEQSLHLNILYIKVKCSWISNHLFFLVLIFSLLYLCIVGTMLMV